eukprot:CAMPEP_0114501430 /NCGR_PEP_ID=MMETSP0109-20121206/8491_1 /TAXON_ID=29199 /ORGANISM="Chlorarachnion reptans, Strain CCCM449" /LENGTH=103 /DNA_ID=CAMNT_0001679153 /DNA_START=658 /DNA_END=970 /DNA_ORIENTATION=-
MHNNSMPPRNGTMFKKHIYRVGLPTEDQTKLIVDFDFRKNCPALKTSSLNPGKGDFAAQSGASYLRAPSSSLGGAGFDGFGSDGGGGGGGGAGPMGGLGADIQ